MGILVMTRKIAESGRHAVPVSLPVDKQHDVEEVSASW